MVVLEHHHHQIRVSIAAIKTSLLFRLGFAQMRDYSPRWMSVEAMAWQQLISRHQFAHHHYDTDTDTIIIMSS
jgi:hypothetical protein